MARRLTEIRELKAIRKRYPPDHPVRTALRKLLMMDRHDVFSTVFRRLFEEGIWEKIKRRNADVDLETLLYGFHALFEAEKRGTPTRVRVVFLDGREADLPLRDYLKMFVRPQGRPSPGKLEYVAQLITAVGDHYRELSEVPEEIVSYGLPELYRERGGKLRVVITHPGKIQELAEFLGMDAKTLLRELWKGGPKVLRRACDSTVYERLEEFARRKGLKSVKEIPKRYKLTGVFSQL